MCQVPAPLPALMRGAMSERHVLLNDARTAVHGPLKGVLWRLIQGGVLGSLVGAMVYKAGYAAMGPQDMRGTVTLSVLLGAGAAFGGFRLIRKAPAFELVGPMLSRCRLCVVCGYDLSATPVAEDGCVDCPECGGAWRLGAAV